MQDTDLATKIDTILDEIDALRRTIRCIAPLAGAEGPGARLRSDQAQTDGKQQRAPLPEPRLVRQVMRLRHARFAHFDSDLFADPVWDMLLELTVAHAEHRRVTVKVLCIASGVPHTTALRWIHHMSDKGLISRTEDQADKRRVFIQLSDKGMRAMADYFAQIVPLTQFAL